MPRTPQVTGREVAKVLRKIGFSVTGQSGSHIKMRRITNGQTQTVIVPDHRVVRKGTFHNILRMARLSLDEFIDLIR